MPLFFLLYINDLPQCLYKTKPRLFADNTNLTASGDSTTHLEAAVNSDLENLRKWLVANKLSLKALLHGAVFHATCLAMMICAALQLQGNNAFVHFFDKS